MRIIRAPALGRAHELVIKLILEKGSLITTEDGEDTIEYDTTALIIDDPLTLPMASEASRFRERFLDRYAEDLLRGSDSVFEYDYHTRLFDWGEGLSASGDDVHVNQIEYIIEKLRSSDMSRRALAITWNPVIDETLDDCPCLQLVQCTVRDGKLNMKVVFRSNDMLTAAGANMYALAHLQKYIAEQTGYSIGRYTHISLVPHIYYKRDINDIEPFCKKGEMIKPLHEICRLCGKCELSKR